MLDCTQICVKSADSDAAGDSIVSAAESSLVLGKAIIKQLILKYLSQSIFFLV